MDGRVHVPMNNVSCHGTHARRVETTRNKNAGTLLTEEYR